MITLLEVVFLVHMFCLPNYW